MGVETKLCCRLWTTHCSSLASELQGQRGAGQCAWAPTYSQGGCTRLGREHSATVGPPGQGRAGLSTGCVPGQAQLGGCEHSAVLRDGV